MGFVRNAGKIKKIHYRSHVLADFVFGWNPGDAAFELGTYVGGK